MWVLRRKVFIHKKSFQRLIHRDLQRLSVEGLPVQRLPKVVLSSIKANGLYLLWNTATNAPTG